MHNHLPNYFIFLDKYNNQIFKNKNLNLGVVYRNYNDKNRERELEKIAIACKKHRFQLFVSNSNKLAIKYKADGIYVPSFNKKSKFSNLEKKNIKILGSAHSQKEIQIKISQNCKAIFLSPAFKIKKSKKYLNLYQFNYLCNSNKTHIFALGGISEKNLKKIKLLNICGFGGISIFKKKPAFFGGRFL